MALHPVILAGGSGTRLWPLSRQSHPKQFLTLFGRRSLLQETVARLDGLGDVAPPLFVCNEEHRSLVTAHLRQMVKTPLAIILEPAGRNTAPALTLAALSLKDGFHNRGSADPVMLAMPSDHVIKAVDAFQAVVRTGAALAEQGDMVAVGIVPTAPNTGYGYIRKGAEMNSLPSAEVRRTGHESGHPAAGSAPFRVAAFMEKPDKATAEKMLKTDAYLWNSGIFIVRASVWLEQLWRYRPDIAEACTVAHAQGQRDGDFYLPDPQAFAACPGDFIAYAMMEKIVVGQEQKPSASGLQRMPAEVSAGSPACMVLPLDAGWSDVGDWASVWAEEEKDACGNALKGAVTARSMRDSLLLGQHRRVIAQGLDNVIVVETADAVLVTHKDYAQDVKVVAEQWEAKSRPEHQGHLEEDLPWGSSETIHTEPHSQIRRLSVHPGAAIPFYRHTSRTAHWIVVQGTATVTRGDEEILLTENQSTSIPPGTWYRVENPGSSPLECIEVQSGSAVGEDDSVEDRV